jgi:tRNA A-37 threonylcarbamoyl transferase component Bud32
VNPVFAARFAALGVDTPAGFLDLPGEVVSGHPDRHVVRAELPGFPAAFYLKRQHAVAGRERLRNRLAGFGWVSRCEREAVILRQLAAAGLPCPRWAAVGADGHGRAFLLVEELAGAVELRRVLRDTDLSQSERARLADHLGRLVALLHATGFTTPDLTAKHVLVSPEARDITLIDWQGARRARIVSGVDRIRCLAALHASVADDLATPRERFRVLHAALRPARKAGIVVARFSDLVRQVEREAARLGGKRSIRDQRHSPACSQRLVWLAGEAVCVIPEAVAAWPSPPIAAPFYGCKPGTLSIRLGDGREAQLIRGRAVAPFARLGAWLRGRSWRSPGVTLGRLLFHLERYGIPAPRLLAFGQRLTGPASAEWFVLSTPPVAPITEPSSDTAEQLGRRLRQLHDAGCRYTGDAVAVFGVDGSGVCVRDITAVRLARRVTERDRADDLQRVLAALAPATRSAAEAGYYAGSGQRSTNRLIPEGVSR